jgi:cyclomaltodextrinase
MAIELGKYRHYKGNSYEVIGVVRHSETLEELVLYKQLYGEGGLWVRPLLMFTETVTIEGQTKPRFEKV